MRVLILGSGPTGSILCARLFENGHDITVLAQPERKIQLLTTGLQLTSPYGRFRRHVHAVAPGEINQPYDLVVATGRAHLLETALEIAAPAIGPDTVLLPICEGVRALEMAPVNYPGRCVIGGVIEHRVVQDADLVAHQRTPHVELCLGALSAVDTPIVEELVGLLAGRGIKTFASPQIRARAWERFSFVVSAIASTHLLRRPLRDTLRFAHGAGNLSICLRESYRIGEAAGFGPDLVRVKSYANSFLLEGRPVAPPARASDDGRAGAEARYLIGEMIEIGRRVGVHPITIGMAWRDLAPPVEVTAQSVPMAGAAAT